MWRKGEQSISTSLQPGEGEEVNLAKIYFELELITAAATTAATTSTTSATTTTTPLSTATI